ncbi:hypothetical protein PENTCL1PPCAC_9976, partial [Pristionchus entomophagus]
EEGEGGEGRVRGEGGEEGMEGTAGGARGWGVVKVNVTGSIVLRLSNMGTTPVWMWGPSVADPCNQASRRVSCCGLIPAVLEIMNNKREKIMIILNGDRGTIVS